MSETDTFGHCLIPECLLDAQVREATVNGMTGRHASTDDVDDQALASQAQEPGAHRAPVDPQGEIGDGSVPADADLQSDPPVEPARTGRRSKGTP